MLDKGVVCLYNIDGGLWVGDLQDVASHKHASRLIGCRLTIQKGQFIDFAAICFRLPYLDNYRETQFKAGQKNKYNIGNDWEVYVWSTTWFLEGTKKISLISMLQLLDLIWIWRLWDIGRMFFHGPDGFDATRWFLSMRWLCMEAFWRKSCYIGERLNFIFDVLCKREVESLSYVFFEFSYSAWMWKAAMLKLGWRNVRASLITKW